MIGGIFIIIITNLYVDEYSGYKEKFVFKEIKNGDSILINFPKDPNITRISLKLKGEISENVNVEIGKNFNIIHLKRSANIDTTFESDCYGNQIDLKLKCSDKCKGNLRGSVRVW
jgi:hypothetical protein